MQQQLYPASVGEDSLEQYAASFANRSSGIYLCVLLLLGASAATLPFVRVDITVRSKGIVRPSIEKRDVRASVAGQVARVFVHDRQQVVAGEVIASLRSASVDERDSLLAAQLATKRRALADLTLLGQQANAAPQIQATITTSAIAAPIALSLFQSTELRQEYAQFVNESRAAAVLRAKAATDLARSRALFDRGFATSADVEGLQFAMDRAGADERSVVDRHRTQWLQALANVRLEIASLESQRHVLREERASYLVRAPVAGTVEELANISGSSYLQSGDRIAVISPTSPLIAEAYVSPRDVGMLHAGMPARMLIDAFNYNDWGFVTGRVLDISTDYVEVANEPMFKVRCALDRDRLVLGNGVTGSLRKGMTLQARFLVARRSLLQLLRDDVTDWLDPALNA